MLDGPGRAWVAAPPLTVSSYVMAEHPEMWNILVILGHGNEATSTLLYLPVAPLPLREALGSSRPVLAMTPARWHGSVVLPGLEKAITSPPASGRGGARLHPSLVFLRWSSLRQPLPRWWFMLFF